MMTPPLSRGKTHAWAKAHVPPRLAHYIGIYGRTSGILKSAIGRMTTSNEAAGAGMRCSRQKDNKMDIHLCLPTAL